MRLTNKKPLFRLVLIAFFIALYVALNLIEIDLLFIQISFIGFPLVLSAILLGPIDGIFVAIIGETINQFRLSMVNPTFYPLTPLTPIWILPPVLCALVIGLIIGKKDIETHKIRWIIAIALGGLSITIGNTIAILINNLLTEYPIPLKLLEALIRGVVSMTLCVIYGILIPIIIKALKKVNKIETTENNK